MERRVDTTNIDVVYHHKLMTRYIQGVGRFKGCSTLLVIKANSEKSVIVS